MTIKNKNNKKYQHIILISLDSLRNDCITAINSSFPDKHTVEKNFKTEMLDYLISQGTYFTNCISAAPYTSASHAAYFTGCWPRRNGVYEFFNRRISRPTIFQLAKKRNIRTIFQTDFPIILGESLGFSRGVDKYFVESEDLAFNELLKNENHDSVSFFHFGGIHYPYGFHKLKFAMRDFPEKVRELERKFSIKKPEIHEDMLDESYRDEKDRDLLLRYKNIIDTLWNRGEYNQLHNLYVEGVDYFLKHRFDPFIKKVIDFVDRTNSLLVLFADHGENWAADSRGHSNAINDFVLRVPVIFYGNGVTKNLIISDLIRTIDITPTIQQYSKIPPSNFDGLPINLSSVKKSIGKRSAFAQVWRVGDRMKIYKHQQKILKDKKMIKPLATKLEKEAMYQGKFVLTREYLNNGKLSKEDFYINSGRDLISIKGNNKIINKFRKELVKYNRIKPSKNKRVDKLSYSIIQDLNDLGYNV